MPLKAKRMDLRVNQARLLFPPKAPNRRSREGRPPAFGAGFFRPRPAPGLRETGTPPAQEACYSLAAFFIPSPGGRGL